MRNVGELFNMSGYAVDCMALPATLRPEKSIEQDVTIDRKHRRMLTVAWEKDEIPSDEERYSLVVECAPGTPLRNDGMLRPSVYVRSGFAGWVIKGKWYLSGVPDGKGTLVISTKDYFGYLPFAEGDRTVTFYPSQTGSIAGRVLRADKSPAGHVRIVLNPAFVVRPNSAWPKLQYDLPFFSGAMTTTAEDGTFRFASIGPGQYVINVPGPNIAPSGQSVEVRAGQESRLELVSEVNATVAEPALRTTGEDTKPAGRSSAGQRRPSAQPQQNRRRRLSKTPPPLPIVIWRRCSGRATSSCRGTSCYAAAIRSSRSPSSTFVSRWMKPRGSRY